MTFGSTGADGGISTPTSIRLLPPQGNFQTII